MNLIYSNLGIAKWVNENNASKIGFVPTMGALHDGHLSLVQKAKQFSDKIVVSIFVNPTQFGNSNDFDQYPNSISEDIDLLHQLDVDAVFLPKSAEELYSDENYNGFSFGSIEKVMEGTHRKGHFDGVARVVKLFLDLIQPDFAFFGEKDYQQLLIIKELTAKIGIKTKIISCETVRETDGLAMSSRNIRLGARGRQKASWISKVLFEARREIKMQKNLSLLKASAIKKLKAQEMEIDYFEIINTDTLQSVKHWDDAEQIVACTSVRVEKVRLLDNILLKG